MHFIPAASARNQNGPYALCPRFIREATMGRGILLWMLGVPIPIIILLALVWH